MMLLKNFLKSKNYALFRGSYSSLTHDWTHALLIYMISADGLPPTAQTASARREFERGIEGGHVGRAEAIV